MAEAASISYGNEFSSEPRKSPLNKHIPESSKVRKTHHPWRGLAHYIVGTVAEPHLTWLNALAVSVQSLHGRIFSFQPSDPQTLLNTIEAFVGLFIEAIVVAVITQRILGK